MPTRQAQVATGPLHAPVGLGDEAEAALAAAVESAGLGDLEALFARLTEAYELWGALPSSAAGTLQRLGAPAVAMVLEGLKSSESPVGRASAMMAGLIGPPADDAAPVLGELLVNDREVFKEAAEGLAGLPSGTKILIKAFKNKDEKVGVAAVRALGNTPGAAKESVPALVKLFTFKKEATRIAALETLARLETAAAGTVAAIDQLIASDASDAVRAAGLRTRLQLSPLAPEALLALATGPGFPQLQQQAINELVRQGAGAVYRDWLTNVSPEAADAIVAGELWTAFSPDFIPTLAKLLESPSPQVQAMAVKAIRALASRHDVGDALPSLLILVGQQRSDVLRDALVAIGTIFKPRQIISDEVVKALDSKASELVSDAGWALRQAGALGNAAILKAWEAGNHAVYGSLSEMAGDPHAAAMLARYVTEARGKPKGEGVWLADRVESLTRVGVTPAERPLLVELLNELDNWITFLAARGLGTLGPADADTIAKVLTLAGKDGGRLGSYSKALAEMGARFSDVLPLLKQGLKSSDANRRGEAIRGLCEFPSEAATILPLLVERTKDRSWWVRRCTAGAIAKFGKTSPEIAEAVKALLEDEKKEVQVDALGAAVVVLPPDQAAALVAPAFEDMDERVRIAAIDATAALGSAAGPLLPLLGKELRAAAVGCLLPPPARSSGGTAPSALFRRVTGAIETLGPVAQPLTPQLRRVLELVRSTDLVSSAESALRAVTKQAA